MEVLYQEVITGIIFGICAVQDLRRKRIEKRVLIWYAGLILVGKAGGCITGMEAAEMLKESVLGLLPGAVCLLISWSSRQGLGYGDSLLILACGFSLGVESCVAVISAAFFLAGIWAMIQLLFRRKGRQYELPFLPFLVAGLVGKWILYAG